mmetsp:Transcript_11138/g.32904  ORF Transcript_11138/g.32904 Transcript_11138/m.32904 type:complete len:273 (+) Transcript_11138:96-914(+)
MSTQLRARPPRRPQERACRGGPLCLTLSSGSARCSCHYFFSLASIARQRSASASSPGPAVVMIEGSRPRLARRTGSWSEWIACVSPRRLCWSCGDTRASRTPSVLLWPSGSNVIISATASASGMRLVQTSGVRTALRGSGSARAACCPAGWFWRNCCRIARSAGSTSPAAAPPVAAADVGAEAPPLFFSGMLAPTASLNVFMSSASLPSSGSCIQKKSFLSEEVKRSRNTRPVVHFSIFSKYASLMTIRSMAVSFFSRSYHWKCISCSSSDV